MYSRRFRAVCDVDRRRRHERHMLGVAMVSNVRFVEIRERKMEHKHLTKRILDYI